MAVKKAQPGYKMQKRQRLGILLEFLIIRYNLNIISIPGKNNT
jgi:hypothetical protein